MDKKTHFECIDYISPEVNIIYANCQKVLCQSGEVPDMNEGWSTDL